MSQPRKESKITKILTMILLIPVILYISYGIVVIPSWLKIDIASLFFLCAGPFLYREMRVRGDDFLDSLAGVILCFTIAFAIFWFGTGHALPWFGN